jgi:hypothetical protein
MLNFKSFRYANCVLAGIELIRMIRKAQFAIDGADAISLPRTIFCAGRNGPCEISWTTPLQGNSAV